MLEITSSSDEVFSLITEEILVLPLFILMKYLIKEILQNLPVCLVAVSHRWHSPHP